jgi:hypothetical protein
MLAGERRDVVPVGDELRALAWIGVMLIATGVGIVITKHFDQIGPLAIAMAIGLVAAFCYAWPSLKKKAALDEYVVLLGALLISADVAFIETQWHLLGSEWQRHFLLLAIVHAVAAYSFGSRAVLSLSIAALAAWMGVEQRRLFTGEVELATRAFLCAGILGVWRAANRKADFGPIFEHFATNIAFWGALTLTSIRDTRPLGVILTLIFAAGSLLHGFRRRRELFVIYAAVYALIAVDIFVLDRIGDRMLGLGYLVVSSIVAIAALFVTHVRFQNQRLANG